MCCNEGLSYVELTADVLQNLIFKFCPIVTKEKRWDSVRADEMGNNGKSYCWSRVVRQGGH